MRGRRALVVVAGLRVERQGSLGRAGLDSEKMFVQILLALPLGMVVGLHVKARQASIAGADQQISVLNPVKGQGIYAFVTLMQGYTGEQTIIEELRALVTEKIGPIARPDLIQWSPNLPKTRSGKIMRRILRKIAEGELQELGDTSTLADPTAVDELISNRVKQSD